MRISNWIIVFASIAICGCNGEVIGTGHTKIEGTAAIGSAIADAKVEIKSVSGEIENVYTDTKGKFSLTPINPNNSHLLRISLKNNTHLYSFASSVGVTNIHPYTDLIIRNWFAAHLIDLENEFSLDMALSQYPTVAEITKIKQEIKDLLALALTDYNIPTDLDLITSAFDADSTGFDRFLDNSIVTIQKEKVTITVTSSDQTSTTVILDEVDLAEDFTIEDTTLPSTSSKLIGVTVDDTRLLLVWNDSTDNIGIAGYTIKRDTQIIASSAYPEFLDTGLTIGTQYCYEVTAFDAAGNESPPVTTIPCPSTKSVVDPQPYFNLHALPRGNSNEIRWDTSTIVDINQVESYELYRGAPDILTVIATFPAAGLPPIYFDTKLDLLTNYCYELRALNSSGSLVAPSAPRCSQPNNISPTPPTLGINESAILFAAEKYYIKESDGSVDLIVNRYGDLSQQFAVSLIARSGTAIAGNDFVEEPGSNTVTWNSNDNLPKTFTMTINTDAIDEPTEYLHLEIKDQNQILLDTASLIILD